MIKKTITYDNYNDETVTEDFYFSINKLEAIEMEMAFDGGLSAHLERLVSAEDGRTAYALFKDVVVKAYGKKSLDGKRFMKNDEIRAEFEESPALGELIFSFINNPQEGAAFIEGCLPAKLVAEAKAAANKGEGTPELSPTAPVLEQTEEPLKTDGKTDEELLAMKPQDMTQPQLVRAMHLKSSVQ